jgi:ABC-type antimicrobial peptide transport system permease subunit
MDATLPVYDVKTLTEHMNIPLFPARMAANVLGSFGLLALVLAAIGIYGVMSYVVAGRTREIGLRMALGAQLHQVRQLILRQGMMLAGIGLILGLAVVLVLARFLTSMLYGVSPSDPVTFLGISFLLAMVALLACYLPARRAARIDPMIAIREE